MKVWEKIYLVTLVVVLIILNIASFAIFYLTYHNSLTIEKNTAISQWKVIADSFEASVDALEERERLNDNTLWELYNSYTAKYYSNKIGFELWDNKQLLYTSDVGLATIKSYDEGDIASPYIRYNKHYYSILDIENNENGVLKISYNNDTYIAVSGKIQTKSSGYTLVMVKQLTEFNKLWSRLVGGILLINLIACLCLALLLFFLLRRALQPLSKLSIAANQIAEGNYKQEIEVIGNDEIAQVSESFNYMAKEIDLAMEAMKIESENKQVFIDDMAHELRTPLTTIFGYAQLMYNVKMDEEKRLKYLEFIISESNRMQSMTNELLQLTILKHETIAFDWFENSIMIKRVTQPLSLLAEEKGIMIEVKTDNKKTYGNETLFENLSVNLIRNAIHACSNGGRIEVTLLENKLIVKDNGCGMTKECQEKIFEPFYREDTSRSRRAGGTGLGMAICKQIVDCHHGNIEIHSEKNEGTEIIVTLHVNQ